MMSDQLLGLSFLLSRLTWPSGVIRERTCLAVAELLANPVNRPLVLPELMKWILNQKLESTAVIGLLALARTKLNDPSFSFQPDDLGAVVRKPSILSWMLINQVLGHDAPFPDCTPLHSGQIQKGFTPDGFFLKYSEAFLPPIHMSMAKKLGRPFIAQWAYEWELLLEELELTPSEGPLYFVGRQERDHYVAFDSLLSEVYRSSYLRALAYEVTRGVITELNSIILAAQTCPIDIGLWKLSPSSKPQWWPKIDVSTDVLDLVPTKIWAQVKDLWAKQFDSVSSQVIACASGRVYESDTITYDISIFGVFQKAFGPSCPGPKKIVEWYLSMPWVHPQTPSLNVEGVLPRVDFNAQRADLDDWSLLPCATQLFPWTAPRWQFWRAFRGVWVPASYLARSPIILRCNEDSFQFSDGGTVIGQWYDWNSGLHEKADANLTPANGQCLLIDRKLVESFAKDTKSVFSWVCCLNGFHRKSDYELYEEFTIYESYGASGIVIP